MYLILTRHPDMEVSYLIETAWALRTRCSNGHSRIWYVSDLEKDFPPQARMSAICERLKCSVCGSSEGEVDFLQDTATASARNLVRHEAEEARRGK